MPSIEAIIGKLARAQESFLRAADAVPTALWKTGPENGAWCAAVHIPLAVVEARLIRRKTPIPINPELVRDKEAMLGELREVRGRTLAFLEETQRTGI